MPRKEDEPAKKTEKDLSDFQVHYTVMNLETKVPSGFQPKDSHCYP